MAKMKCIVKARPEKGGLSFEEREIPKPGFGEVLIKNKAVGICGTDLHIYNWDAWSQKNVPVPLVIGHEFVGRVVEVGANVKDFYAGEIVSGEGHVVCGRCRNCLAGRRHLCKDTKGIGVNRPGAFAEYLSIPVTNVWPVWKDIPPIPELESRIRQQGIFYYHVKSFGPDELMLAISNAMERSSH